jgi:hypothetical protein
LRKILQCLAALMGLAAGETSAITRHDVLECGLSDGSKFLLRSEYEWMALPLPVGRHGSRESKRRGWVPSYKDKSGKEVRVPGMVEYGGEAALAIACSYFGMKQGVPLAHFSFRRTDGGWLAREQFPMARLDIKVDADNTETLQRALQQAGIKGTAFHFGLIYAEGQRLIYEKPLYRVTDVDDARSPIDAVFQAVSDDGGVNWSEGRVTTEARIFELGRAWGAQSFLARPLLLNGKPVP